MIEETTKYSCRSGGSGNIIRNGHNKCGSPQYKCKACGACRVLTPKVKYTPEQKATILRSYRERISLRGLQRVFGVWRTTVLRWLKVWVDHLPSLQETLLPAQVSDVLELDELVSFVAEKFFKRWLWLAMCRRTRQIVAYAIGDRSETTAQKLWQAIPEAYRVCPIYTDDYNVYPLIILPNNIELLPKKPTKPTTRSVGTTPSANGWVVTPARPCPFPKRIFTIHLSPIGSLSTIISECIHHLLCDHHH